MRLPTKISGLFAKTELIPTEISLAEVKNPKRRNETANEESLSLWERCSTALMASPDPIQMPTKAPP